MPSMPGGGKGKGDGVPPGMAEESEETPPEASEFPDPTSPELPGLPADLLEVRIRPRVALMNPGDSRPFSLKAFDTRGQEITDAVEIAWSLTGDPVAALSSVDGTPVTVTAKAIGLCELNAAVTLNGKAMSAGSKIRVLEKNEDSDLLGNAGKGLPHYELVTDIGAPWRSRYRLEKNTIEVNAGHPDYLGAKTHLTGLRRYLMKIYAKEIVILNFPSEKPAAIAERMIELLTRLENLTNKEGKAAVKGE